VVFLSDMLAERHRRLKVGVTERTFVGSVGSEIPHLGIAHARVERLEVLLHLLFLDESAADLALSLHTPESPPAYLGLTE
jgi:hypothetical protein